MTSDQPQTFSKEKIINLNSVPQKKARKFTNKVISAMILLHIFGLGDVLRRFELEQITGLKLMGFRPLSLDELMHWSQHIADQQNWDVDSIRQDVISIWLDQAEDITCWRQRLDRAPAEVELLAGIGDQNTWRDHWEGMLRQTPRAGWQ